MADNSSSKLRPDLDENINVPEAHAALNEEGTAVARENALRENGMEPVGLWMLLICGIVLLVGGSVLGRTGFFNYELYPTNYARMANPNTPPQPLPPIAISALLKKEGAKIYSKCSGCHGADGAGSSEVPPLAGSEWVTGPTERLSQIILHGLDGPITVAGKPYKFNMPQMGDGLGPKELAAVMTFIRSSWGNDASLVTPEMAAEALKISNTYEGQVTVPILEEKHNKMLPGEPIDPSTLFDPETFTPVEQPAAE